MTPANQSPDNDLEMLKVYIQAAGYIITWIIVVIGWYVNNNQNKKRDERKDLRDQINDIAEIVRNVEADAVTFLTTPEGPTTVSYWTVFLGVKRINTSIVRDKVFKTEPIEKALIAYRSSITNDAMPGPDTPPKKKGEIDSDLRKVSKSGNALVRALEDRYAEKYPRN